MDVKINIIHMILSELLSLHPKIIVFQPVRVQAALWASLQACKSFGNGKWYFCQGKVKSLRTRAFVQEERERRREMEERERKQAHALAKEKRAEGRNN